ncbi:MAG: ABC transporter permease [Clostridia bacterium]|nr:ABC transporter permease [Oscillospiraceae bacterium]MBR6574361.1 ABC transporter permease [Clostridia bacterium]
MLKYSLKRLGYMAVVLVILSVIMYMIYSLVPANRAYSDADAQVKAMKNTLPKDQLADYFDKLYLEYQRKYGTDTNNKFIRYGRWVGIYPLYDGSYNGLLQGNLGYSYEYQKPVVEVVKQPMLNTIKINIWATILALGITLPLGIYCAVKRGSKFDQGIQVMTIVGYSLPTFLISILFIWVFCSKLGIFPPSGMQTPGNTYVGFRKWLDEMYYLALPLIVMTFCSLGGMTRYVRASMIEALSLDCIKTARAKGLKEKAVIYSHAWRNALIPIVTLVVGWFLGIFGGSLVIESMFALNGMGRLMIQSLRTADYDVVLLMQMFYVAMALIGNLVIDIIYGLVDPRVRVSK